MTEDEACSFAQCEESSSSVETERLFSDHHERAGVGGLDIPTDVAR